MLRQQILAQEYLEVFQKSTQDLYSSLSLELVLLWETFVTSNNFLTYPMLIILCFFVISLSSFLSQYHLQIQTFFRPSFFPSYLIFSVLQIGFFSYSLKSIFNYCLLFMMFLFLPEGVKQFWLAFLVACNYPECLEIEKDLSLNLLCLKDRS